MLSLHQVGRVFKEGYGQQVAVDGVSFEMGTSEFAILSGRSGSGKTTLLNMIGGLEIPDRGQILFEGRDLASMSDVEISIWRRDRVGFIFQTFNLIPVLSAFENVEYPLILQGVLAIDRKKRVLEIMEKVGLQAHVHSKPSQLSGGQRQRVAIARALVKRPSLILADEPTANLDVQTSRDVVSLIQDLYREQKGSIIFCTHDADMIQRGTRRFEMSDGKLVGDRRQT
jgi:putative ABC transport system ATP-binding protein